eukprot:TRINITY_DN8408_c1_g1_i1.p2 TRINITY_DN8408_c1_g1~~TRINITY_DN8408_c1_g1_i1.p2  ORF type:complete len:132 (+),score=15.69 TRINITY_DN8408_c1_g1_i1:873-1268(+)
METALQELAPPSGTAHSSSPQSLASSEADEQYKETAEEPGMETAEEELMKTAQEGSGGTDVYRLLAAAETNRARREVEQVWGQLLRAQQLLRVPEKMRYRRRSAAPKARGQPSRCGANAQPNSPSRPSSTA